MPDPILSVTGVTALRERIEVVTDFSADLGEGEFVGLLGANGAGKTTCVDAICGFAPKKKGSVHFDGADITGLSPHQIARRGLIQVSQDRELFSGFTVEENIVVGSRAAADRAEPSSVDSVYELFPRLLERRSQQAGSLSGGEQQMLAIARALVGDPRFLILDEPTSGLAPVVVREVMEFLGSLKSSGLSILLVEQNVQVAVELCDRIIVLRNGEKIFDGARDELGSDPVDKLGEMYV
ncbi:MAG: ATP-binding cassette domain-containing protein [Acidimicrobiia bacterium]|nr:ATP-binding cassette domain-containing protein [Acidimicrobiia bacterium]